MSKLSKEVEALDSLMKQGRVSKKDLKDLYDNGLSIETIFYWLLIHS